MKRYWRIARMGLYLGATVFGGVAAAYPYVRAKASELGDISPEEVDGLYAVAVFLPGPSFLNLWGAVSARVGGLLGALLGQVALILPAFLLVLLLPLTTRIPWIGAHSAGALNGTIWATSGLLLATGIEGIRKLKTWQSRAVAILGLGLLVAGVHPVLLLVCGIAGGVLAAVRQPAKREAA